jgi:hypothetical protein
MLRHHTVDTPIAILVSLADHLVNLLIREFLANRRHDVTKLSSRDETIVVAIKDLLVMVRSFILKPLY